MNQILLFLSCVLAVVADMSLVWWAKSPKHSYFFLAGGIIIGMAALLIWAYTLRKGIESATAITVYSLLTVAGCSFLGIIVFKEALSLLNAIGIVVAMIALILVSL